VLSKLLTLQKTIHGTETLKLYLSACAGDVAAETK